MWRFVGFAFGVGFQSVVGVGCCWWCVVLGNWPYFLGRAVGTFPGTFEPGVTTVVVKDLFRISYSIPPKTGPKQSHKIHSYLTCTCSSFIPMVIL
jgi:hypothetical protein